ncbi:MAG: AI-2E family transporter [Burkholderiaceae bacterium]|nr:AI-2E family transporter [Burkholderiaceae bacterium]
MVSLRDRFDIIIRLLCGAAVAVGCYYVVSPFLTAILLAAILTVVTWPLYRRIENSMGDRPTPAAILMVALLMVCVIIPLSFLSAAVAQQLPDAIRGISGAITTFTVPLWLNDIPGIGSWLFEQATELFQPKAMAELLERLINPLSRQVVSIAMMLGNGLVQLLLVALIAFFFYRDGNYLARKVGELVERISGDLSDEFSYIIVSTTRSVVYGIVGTAAGQAMVACVGFMIVGAPSTLLLSVAVFVLSVVPVGPPLVWGPVAIWLYGQGEIGMAVFMIAWGLLAIASVDNFLKPLLIARGTPLPISLVFLGVFGGVIAFGFLGLILGPVLLAIGVAMMKTWLSSKNRKRIARHVASITHVAPKPQPAVRQVNTASLDPAKSISTLTNTHQGAPRRDHPKTKPQGRQH